jgi:hypothetical protein
MPATQASATPTPAEQAASVKALLANLDPCAGPLELQSKTGITPCVYVAGEGAFSYGYTSVNIPGTITASGDRGFSFTRNFAGHVDAYPGFAMEIGITAHSQISIIAPSSIETSVHLGGQAVSGASDMQFSYKQMVFANLQSATLLSLEATYEAPVGAMPFAAPGPSYNAKLIFGQGLPKHFGIAGQLPLIYEVASTNTQGQNTYGFQFVPTLLPYWQSPGGTLIAVAATHMFSPNITPISVAVLQLINRHVQIGVAYGGVNSFTDIAGPIPQIVHFNTSVYPRLLSVNLYFLAGESNFPPAFVEMEKQKAEQQQQQQK